MSQLGESVECYLLENNLGSPRVRHCQKLQGLLEEEIPVTCSGYCFSLARQNTARHMSHPQAGACLEFGFHNGSQLSR